MHKRILSPAVELLHHPTQTAAPRTRDSVRRASGFVQIPIRLRTRAPVYRLISLSREWRRALQHIESQHPPDKEYCNDRPRNMDDPVATCFRIAEIEHDGIVARGSNKAPIGSWRKIAIALTIPNRFTYL